MMKYYKYKLIDKANKKLISLRVNQYKVKEKRNFKINKFLSKVALGWFVALLIGLGVALKILRGLIINEVVGVIFIVLSVILFLPICILLSFVLISTHSSFWQPVAKIITNNTNVLSFIIFQVCIKLTQFFEIRITGVIGLEYEKGRLCMAGSRPATLVVPGVLGLNKGSFHFPVMLMLVVQMPKVIKRLRRKDVLNLLKNSIVFFFSKLQFPMVSSGAGILVTV
ncbi:MAG: hypothetical protein EOM73_11750 [Bacteroidia bacterium]|nr:hypothetical protein [Bacteroidia bacterium]